MDDLSATANQQPIARRRIHYFSGFDPRGAAHYHRLCREQAAMPQPHGGVLEVGAREKVSPNVSRWHVGWRMQEGVAASVDTEHVFMGWDDVVRAHWSRRPLALAREFVLAYAHMFRHIGALRVWRMYRPAFNAGVLPLIALLGPLLLAGVLTATLGLWGLATGVIAIGAAWAVATRAGLFWLLRIFAFYRRMGIGPVPGLDARSREWVDLVVERQQQDPVDEVLLVGHSVGALVMVATVDALLCDERWRALKQERPTCVLTLGQSFPMVALAPAATALRNALQRLSHHPALRWWDVTARIDPLCFYNLHPLAGSALAHESAAAPVRHTARFMHMYAPHEWSRIRRDKLRAHFLYLMTPTRPGNFSPADVLYGPRSLAQQMAAKGAAPDA
jgi:hypothetical protein